MIHILATGPQSLIQDLGRSGWANIGVGPSGAFARGALRLANRLVGNRETTACIETLGGGFRLAVNEPTIVCVTGSDGPISIITNGVERLTARNAPIALGADEVLAIDSPTFGLRSYVAIRQGLRVESTLGSASTDTLASIGPAVLVAGQEFSLANEAISHPPLDLAVARPISGPLHVILGPRYGRHPSTAGRRTGDPGPRPANNRRLSRDRGSRRRPSRSARAVGSWHKRHIPRRRPWLKRRYCSPQRPITRFHVASIHNSRLERRWWPWWLTRKTS